MYTSIKKLYVLSIFIIFLFTTLIFSSSNLEISDPYHPTIINQEILKLPKSTSPFLFSFSGDMDQKPVTLVKVLDGNGFENLLSRNIFGSSVLTTPITADISEAVSNPAMLYCLDLGYKYDILTDGTGGQIGVCIFPDGSSCNQWDFYAGSCGQNFSFCAKNGYGIATREDGKDPFSRTYSVCLNKDGSEAGSASDLAGLPEKLSGSDFSEPPDKLPPSKDVPPSAPEDLDSTLPTSIDWRNYLGYNWLTPIKNQASCGSCWAFAAVGAVEAHKNIIASDPTLDLDLSEQYLVSCSGSGSCLGGSSNSALAYIRDFGVVDEACMPYTATDSACTGRCSDYLSRLTFIDILVTNYSPNPTLIKQAVVDNGPIYVSMGIGADFGGYFIGDVAFCSNDSDVGHTGSNHAVVIVGYNDTGNYWIVRNSWGSTWNGDGYFKVAYGECNIDSTRFGYPVSISPPPNDNMADAIEITGTSFTDTQNTLGASTEAGEPTYSCAAGGTNDNSVWYTLTPTAFKVFTIDTFGSDYDTVLHVFEDNGAGSYSLVGCNDDAVGTQSEVQFIGEAGTTYLISVTSYGINGGNLVLNSNSAPLPGGGTYDDRYSTIQYTGDWSQVGATGPYNGTLTFSSTIGSTATFSFEGEGLALLYTAASNRGTLEVSIDGSPPVTIDMYSATTIWQQEWNSGLLSAGVHTVTFTHASGWYVDIDAIKVTGPPPCLALTLSHTGNGTDPMASPTNSTGCAAGEYYPGETITLSGAAPDPGWGIVGWTGTDNNGSTADTNTVTMPDSAHTATVVYGVPPGPGTYDDRDPNVSYTGTWLTANATGPYAGTITYSQAVWNSGSFTFYGEGVTLVFTKHSSRGVMEVSIDGGPPVDVNMYSGSLLWQEEWYSGPLTPGAHTITFTHKSGGIVDVDAFIVHGPPPCHALTLSHTGNGTDPTASPTNSTGCSAGEYHPGETITLSGATPDPGWGIIGWTGTDNNGSTADTNTVTMPDSAHDATVVYGIPPGVGTYDDRDPNVSYTGSWLTADATGPYAGTLTYSQTVGSSGSFTFYGEGITLVFTKHTSRGVMEVSIDGGPPVDVNMYSGSLLWQEEWYSGTLAPGVHTITFSHKSGGIVDVDAFIVHGPLIPPSNDNIIDAIVISALPFTDTKDTAGASLEASEPAYNCGSGGGNGHSVWYSYTPSSDSIFYVDTLGSTYDTVVNVFEDLGGGSYLPIICNDDNSGFLSKLAFKGTAGHTYLISITAYGGSEGEDLSFSMDEIVCSVGSLCMTVADERGETAYYPKAVVLDGSDNWVSSGWGTSYGYIELFSVPSGSYKVITSSETRRGNGLFIVDSSVSAPGYFSTSSEGLPSVDVIVKDSSGNPITAEIIFSETYWGNGWIGYSWYDWPLTVYFTPGLLNVSAVGWDDYHLLTLGNLSLDAASGSVILDASTMVWETVTYHWDGFTEGESIYWIPFTNYGVGWTHPSGQPVTVSIPAGEPLWHDTELSIINTTTGHIWNYYFDSSSSPLFIDTLGANTDITVGGSLWVDTFVLYGPVFLPGTSKTLYSEVYDAHLNNLYWISHYDPSSTSELSSLTLPNGKSILFAPPVGYDRDRVNAKGHPTPSDTHFDESAGPDAGAWLYPSPTFTVYDGADIVIPGTKVGSGLRTSYEFTIPDPANLGLWKGQASYDFGPYPLVDSSTGLTWFYVVDSLDPFSVGKWDDRESHILYSSGWLKATTPGPYDGTITYSSTIGNTGSFTFDGEGITLVFTKHSSRGVMEVSIDGGPPVDINMYSGSLLWQQEWSSGPLTPGIHTINFTHKSGGIVDLDAFIVHGPPPCHALTLSHTGNGTDPVASPTNSTGCPVGQYHPGEAITLSGAVPDPGSAIVGWTGTDNNGSTADTNTVTMPDSAHTATVVYDVPPGVGKYDDRYAGVSYTGSWLTADTTGPYLGTFTYSQTIGNSGSFTFEGEGITLIYLAHSSRGVMEVSIDGGPPVDINMYSGSLLWQQEWSSGPLAPGVHTITFTHKSGGIVDVDAFIVHGPPPCHALTLSHTGNGTDPVASPTSSTGCAAGEYHPGETITLSGAVPDPGWGIIGWTGTDNNGSTADTNTLTMPDSAHAATVVYGLPPGVGAYDDRDANIGYTGAWNQVSATGPYAGTLTYSGTVGNSGSFTFDGEGIKLVFAAASSYGVMEVSIDGGPPVDINMYSSTTKWQQEWYSGPLTPGVHTITFSHKSGKYVSLDAFIVMGPPPCYALTLSHTGNGTDPVASPTNSTSCAVGQYHPGETITLSGAVPDLGWGIIGWTGTDNNGSTADTNTLTMPDSAHTATVVYGILPGAGTYDDRFAGIIYTGSWIETTTTGPYSSTLTYSSVVGNSFSFTFTGTGITLVYTGAFNRGIMEVSIDGGPPVAVNMYSASILWQQEWYSGALSPGVHTITCTHASGGFVDIDALIVSDAP